MNFRQPEEGRVLVCVRGNQRDADRVSETLRAASHYDVISAGADCAAGLGAFDVGIFVARNTAEAARLLRPIDSTSGEPILVVCPDPSPSAAVACLRDGADDYIVSPFDPGELLARVARSARRHKKLGAAPLKSAPDGGFQATAATTPTSDEPRISLREDDWTIVINHFVGRFTEAQFRIFAHLASSAGRWVRTQVLQDRILKSHAATGASNVRFHILNIRTTLGSYAVHLHGWQRRGYMWSLAPCDTLHCSRN